jgi:hypothetical protein
VTEAMFSLVFKNYFFLSYRVATILSDISRLDETASSHTIVASIWGHLAVFWQCVLLNGILAFSFRLLGSIIVINFTRRHEFVATGEYSIVKAMNSDSDLLSHLAFFDFYFLTSQSKIRRSEFFILSQPGKSQFKKKHFLIKNTNF